LPNLWAEPHDAIFPPPVAERDAIAVGSKESRADLIHTTAAAFGLSALLMTSALAFSVVKYLGAGYLIYLGIRTLLRRDEQSHLERVEPKPLPRMFFQGMTVELLNRFLLLH
jgi:threonine/homoserine/homoserine lactone efflux protein